MHGQVLYLIINVMQNHNEKVAKISSEVKKYFDQKKPFHIFHGSTNSTRILSFKSDQMINVSNLDNILSVDRKKMLAIVEPNMPMDKLVKATLKYSLVPPIIMEFPGITVGGGIQGAAAESSSFNWGCFNETFSSYEMILANGDIVKASPSQNDDLFYGTAGSYGSLGIITSAEINLVSARKYVRLTYLRVNSFDSAIKTMQEHTSKNFDFIDGIMFDKDSGLIIVGKMTDEVFGKIQYFSRAHDPWFYLHAEDICKSKKQHAETVPLVDYLFRYNRGAFWVGKYAFDLFDVTFTRFTRWLLDSILHTRKLYQALQESGASQKHLVQDMAVPFVKSVEFLEYIDRLLGIYPLWLCPMKPDTNSTLLPNKIDTDLAINVGIWGGEIKSYEKFVNLNRQLEAKLRSLGGKKCLYAQSFYNEKEFWKIYDKEKYDKLRVKYHAETLPNVYEKTRVKKIYEVNVKRGLYKTILGQAKIRIDK